ncbi:hypothetical protein [Paracoccus xiamenensis]|uniref:hypothetical protein n=1 Tax=Paracoccus xiamenensis TaxID=2714901 RepID=UPI00140D2928|nr:hypothetical protein [Paracoccus xiamenensis]NHF74173.1 hypothetical protein [Paracoccus xiamenensis]
MGRTAGAALALCLTAVSASALTPLPPCNGDIESGMRVSNAESFGYYGSGFATEDYANALEDDAGADGVYDYLDVPVGDLARFSGYRVIDCKSGEFLAISHFGEAGAQRLTATEFLRSKVQEEKPISLADVRRAAEALYKGLDVAILTLRETEQTCSCKNYGGQ